jgi:hypothetical protein
MLLRKVFWVVPLIGLVTVGCGATASDSADSSENDLGKAKQFDHDFVLPNHTFPLTHTFTETLTRYGVTVTPALTVGGSFAITNPDIHAQVQYTANPPRVERLDIFGRAQWEATARVDVDVKAGASWKKDVDWRKSFTTGTSLGGKAFEILKTPLARIPLPQAPELELQLDLELAAACELDFDAELHAYATVGVGGLASADVYYDKTADKKVGFAINQGLSRSDQFHVTTQPTVAFKDGNLAQVHGRCSIQPSLNATVALLSAPDHPLADVGVKLIVEPYAQFDGDFKAPSDWSVDAKVGIQGTVAPFGDFFGRPWQAPGTLSLTLFDYPLGKAATTPTGTTPDQ